MAEAALGARWVDKQTLLREAEAGGVQRWQPCRVAAVRQHLGDARFNRWVGKPLSPADVRDVLQDWARVHVN